MNYVIDRPTAPEAVEMRGVYGELLSDLATTDERIVVLDADQMRANGTFNFKDQFKDR